MSQPRPSAVVVLAAGEGTRMKSPTTPKVLHAVAGRSLLGHVLAAAAPLHAAHTVVVVGHGRDLVTTHLAAIAPAARSVVQEQQHGTGHAARVALEALAAAGVDLDGIVVVLPGDAPLLTSPALAAMLEEHVAGGNAATLLTARLPDPTGYGRIVRDPTGAVRAIVEQRDADEATLAVREVGTSVYAFDAVLLREALGRLTTDNAQGEEYLTDVVALFVADGRPVGAVTVADHRDAAGVNDRAQLASAGAALRERIVHAAMVAGVTVTDPSSTWIDADVVIETDAVIEPYTILKGHTVVRAGAVVGPSSQLTDTIVEQGASVLASTTIGAHIGAGAEVGPYTYLRPGTVLGADTKAGAYVEIKNSQVGDGSKVPHLSYVGDATIGERTNIGAATVFVNYDGVHKHHSTVGSDVRIGSDSMIVAPVTIGDGAYTAAGSVIIEDVPAGALAVARGVQRNVLGWVARKRPGSRSAQSAQAATAQDNGSQRPEVRDQD
ncbi:MAG: bifunctional UDP-N-acetylglucosamine pyrophosphorylase / glucosamine-phosphate N-acetyltransferase [Frankiales bacterium]|nr:bifunctional UDP-N-acetylglucosamine pyrophosphorylase / glucosamine-phosphate N-acetyltransferase [Frankiales bacterium]